ncbi:prepilin-type N-terminal cleavage/methylation domain-containing protein [Candidatus Parcubacteria bacterium]|nr:MAG: prepilin-type N-terminal cleavage/methylation domain-containing protein [Candidatus Parcubacteria bacterium]
MRTYRKGFTLIEMLVVIAIIAILAGAVLVGLGGARRSGADARRVSDLQHVRTALELYYNRYQGYPTNEDMGCEADDGAACYLSLEAELGQPNGFDPPIVQKLPHDPRTARPGATGPGTNGEDYMYSSPIAAGGQKYLLGAIFDNVMSKSQIAASKDAASGAGFDVDVSGKHSCGTSKLNGETEDVYCIGSI